MSWPQAIPLAQLSFQKIKICAGHPAQSQSIRYPHSSITTYISLVKPQEISYDKQERMIPMRKICSIVLSLCVLVSMTACSGSTKDSAEIIVFAAASMQESLNAVIQEYKATVPDVNVVVTYDSSGILKTQIQEGAPCDLFISAAPKQMNALDGSIKDDTEKNPDGLDFIVEGSRLNLLENKVVLAVPEGNPTGIESFDQLASLLKNGKFLLAIANSDVPVGQYTQEIFSFYGIDEESVSSHLTYGSNVKEVTTQVSSGAVDCGIIYGTDAFSSNLTVVDCATAEMCGQVIYPAAVINSGSQGEAAQKFLDYLCTDEALHCFEAVGFSPMGQ